MEKWVRLAEQPDFSPEEYPPNGEGFKGGGGV